MNSVVNQIKSLIRLAVITAFSSDDKKFPIHQVEYMGKKADACAWYPYGYHANPGPEVLNLLFSVIGNAENRVMLPSSPKERPKPLVEGEVIFYNPTTQSFIHLKADGSIDINSKTDLNVTVAGNLVAAVEGNLDVNVAGSAEIDSIGDLDITAPNTNITGAVNIVGDVDIIGDLVTLGDADIGKQGFVGLGAAHGIGANVVRKGDSGSNPLPEGSTKVTAVGPSG